MARREHDRAHSGEPSNSTLAATFPGKLRLRLRPTPFALMVGGARDVTYSAGVIHRELGRSASSVLNKMGI